MLDFGWAELMLIMALAVIVIGPKELPGIMRLLGQFMRRLHYIKYAFSRQFDEFMQEADLDDIRDAVNFETRRRSASFDEAAADEEGDDLPELEYHPAQEEDTHEPS